MTRLERWLRRRGFTQPASDLWTLAFPGFTVRDAGQLPATWEDEEGRVKVGFAVALAGQHQTAGAYFAAFEPAAAWARSGRQSSLYGYVEIRDAAAVTLWDNDLERDLRAILIGGDRDRSDDACRRWAQQLDARTSSWVATSQP